jgi:hypothetical protein
MSRRLFTLLSCLMLLALLAGASGPATAAKKAPKSKDAIWRGRVDAHSGTYEYVGRGCPETAQCSALAVRLQIVAKTGQVRRALPQAVGREVRLRGRRQGDSLVVRQLTPVDGSLPAPGGDDDGRSGVEGSVNLVVCGGQPLSCQPTAADDVEVVLLRPDGSRAGSDDTDDGSYRIVAPPGSYTVRVDGDKCSSDRVVVTAGRFTRADLNCIRGLPYEVDSSP